MKAFYKCIENQYACNDIFWIKTLKREIPHAKQKTFCHILACVHFLEQNAFKVKFKILVFINTLSLFLVACNTRVIFFIVGSKTPLAGPGLFSVHAQHQGRSRALIGGGGCIFIHSCYARLISFEINPNNN